MTGQYDPIVPPGWGQQAAQTLPNAYRFEFPGMGHGVSFGGCAQTMLLAFLEDPSAAPDDTCLAESEVAPFVVPAPITLRVVFQRAIHADVAALVPGSERVNGRTVAWTGEDMPTVYKVFEAMATLAAAGK